MDINAHSGDSDMNTEIKVLAQDSDLNYDVTVRIIRSGVNRNRWDYQNIAEYAMTFLGTPILCAYVGEQIGDGHNFREITNADGDVEMDFRGSTAERIVGAISDNAEDIQIVSDEEGDWVVAKGKLWRFYNSQLVDKIAQMGTLEVSAETMVEESYMDGDIEVFTKWYGLGVTILNEKVAPAVPGANIRALQEIESEFKELKLKVASLHINADEDIGDEEDDEDELDDDDSDETNDEPQAKTTERNEAIPMNILSKKQLAELAPKFEGYTVLQAGQDENGIHICLMSATGDTAVYTMDSFEDLVDPKKIARVNAKASFAMDEWAMDVDVESITDDLSAKLSTRNSELEVANNELETAKETIKSMTEKEMKRRVSAAKAKAQSTLDAFNANREEKVDAKILEHINECIDNGDFSECENADGEWCGEEEVMNQVLAACAKEVMEIDKKATLAKNSQFVWDSVNKTTKAVNGDVESLLAQFNIN